jgi:hypothetical protein
LDETSPSFKLNFSSLFPSVFVLQSAFWDARIDAEKKKTPRTTTRVFIVVVVVVVSENEPHQIAFAPPLVFFCDVNDGT